MSSGPDRSLAASLLDRHPTFEDVRARIGRAVARSDGLGLDDLARVSALPSRTVLLVAARMVERDQLRIGNGLLARAGVRSSDHVDSGSVLHHAPSGGRRVPDEAFERYEDLISTVRPEPALLWTQRWLTTRSARRRAEYVVNHPLLRPGPLVFLGDDDAASPLAALLEPDREIVVVDVDAAVLEMVERLASVLGATLRTVHHDLADGSLELGPGAAAVVCDPFPTRTGDFERAFWGEAAGLLDPAALLFTTSHPSHKPANFSRLAVRALDDAGFVLVDALRDAGQYALFDFELLSYERALLSAHDLEMTTSHTKSLICAVRAPGASTVPRAELSGSPASLERHYLTEQYGVTAQVAISQGRRPERSPKPAGTDRAAARPYRVSALLEGLETDIGHQAGLVELLERGESSPVRDLLAGVGLAATPDDVETLVSLHRGATPATPDAERLALAVRSLESWHR